MERLADDLRRRHPTARFQVYSHPVGAKTEYQGHDVGIECLLPEVEASRPDNVALAVSLCHLTTAPRIMADVAWGHPSGHCEASFRDWHSTEEWPEATPETLAALEKALPELIAVFTAAVKRGHPGDEEPAAGKTTEC